MKTRKNLFVVIPLAFLFLLGLCSFGANTASAKNPNMVTPGEFLIDPPTLINLGFEWFIEGDDNHDATVEVKYRKKGDHQWKQGLPLLRIMNEVLGDNRSYYMTPNMFAGSILDLEPDTEYECLFVMDDPDGVHADVHPRHWDCNWNTHHKRWEAEKLVTVRTRPEPKPYVGGNVYHVYPRGYSGPRIEPSFSTLMDAYQMYGSGGDWSKAALNRVQPGDIILMHAGLYDNDWRHYSSGTATSCAPFDGTYYLTAKGTAKKPIVIKAAGDGEVIFDFTGSHTGFNVLVADYHYFEGLTIRNTDIGFLAGIEHITGSSGLTIKKCRFEDVGMAVITDYSGSENFYIADNVMIGRHDPDHLLGWSGTYWAQFPGFPPENKSPWAVKVYGRGHVVCYNYVANFHDGIDNQTVPNPDGWPNAIRWDRRSASIDFYNNFLTNFHDNPLEADGGMHNIRIMRNLMLNSAAGVFSCQPCMGGPTYWIRNISYHNPSGGALKHLLNSPGVFYYHNTLSSESSASLASNTHWRNNLQLGEGLSPEIFIVNTTTNYSSSDYNGYRPNTGANVSFRWNSPDFGVLRDFSGLPSATPPLVQRSFHTLAEYSQGTGQDTHSILVDYDVFVNVPRLDRNDLPNVQKLIKPEDVDFQLKPGSAAVDAGCILPNVNDDFTGQAPDLGALEYGRPVPHYGPRP